MVRPSQDHLFPPSAVCVCLFSRRFDVGALNVSEVFSTEGPPRFFDPAEPPFRTMFRLSRISLFKHELSVKRGGGSPLTMGAIRRKTYTGLLRPSCGSLGTTIQLLSVFEGRRDKNAPRLGNCHVLSSVRWSGHSHYWPWVEIFGNELPKLRSRRGREEQRLVSPDQSRIRAWLKFCANNGIPRILFGFGCMWLFVLGWTLNSKPHQRIYDVSPAGRCANVCLLFSEF